MKQYRCENCGASINPDTGICEYCGTRYEIRRDNLIRIEAFHNPVRVYGATVEVSNELAVTDPEGISQYAVDHLAHKLADAIKENLDVKVEDCWERRTQRITARIRIVEPKYLF